ncbi:Eco57I restriction-modification methylase domain-containing protein [Corynebacterium cystitidis]|uniref:site-specific DNA-methyltransferase (adenine-specific) n=1 Tax=Corynebacterium cystitidis DSM 20524 TaxID=1121357 RepID=A0A1H9U5W7_9CORY|nr:hypothetical protein [Corynebacterium cystitidis]WJY81193.1 Restriction-modification methylase [Corynebacterium cystitidis DSM 20524]SES04836.1 hypothetical protein SAMN05661109_01680 [Corynebacterium cystitidis DSM 20524]SNV89540.1 type II restriction enzyme, methylase subunit [Corynebacterium cystitidis]
MRPDPSLVEDFLSEVLENNSNISETEWAFNPAAHNVDAVWASNFDLKWRFSNFQSQGPLPVEAAYAATATRPSRDNMEKLWKTLGRSAAGFLVAVLYGDEEGTKVAITGPTQTDAPVYDLSPRHAENVFAATLAQTEPNNAILRAQEMLGNLRDGHTAPALINAGLFTNHELSHGVPRRPDWEESCAKGAQYLSFEGRDLFSRLGFTLEQGPNSLTYLKADGTNRAVAALLERHERFDQQLSRFNSESPVRLAQATAREQGVAWVIVQSGKRVRLYPTQPTQPVAGGTLTDRYLQLDLAQLEPKDAGYLTLLFTPESLAPEGSADKILESSKNHAVNLIDRLKERVYADVVPGLSVGVATALRAQSQDELQHAYHRSLVILFRLIFVAYAEDEGLLPYALSASYRKVSITRLARQLTENPQAFNNPSGFELWDQMEVLWSAIDQGNPQLNVPAYNGGLFRPEGPDPQNPWSGQLRVPNSFMQPVLSALLVDESSGERGPVDFRSLDVTAFGTLYEGLLESELSIAAQDLVVSEKGKTKGVYVPAPDGTQEAAVKKGAIYFHSASGERKATGSYFTPSFAVDYLLDNALEPVLERHLAKVKAALDAGEPTEKVGEMLFDFRVIDPSMGSAHFLVAAVDRIGAAFLDFLTNNELPSVSRELETLRNQALDALDAVGISEQMQASQSSSVDISFDRILNRQVARRCIYGIDLNLMAVELARLAIWIRTFVPGLPMASLGQRLVNGNALIGIAHHEEVVEILDPNTAEDLNNPDQGTQFSFARNYIEPALTSAGNRLRKLGMASEGTIAQVKQAQEEYDAIWNELEHLRSIFDWSLAVSLDLTTNNMAGFNLEDEDFTLDSGPLEVLEGQRRLHLPLVFPEVMMRDNPGFDVVLGNPPWEKIKLEEHTWWTIRIPGLRSMSQKDKNAAIEKAKEDRPDLAHNFAEELERTDNLRDLMKKLPYPIGSGDQDLYKVFCWRDWDILRNDGRIGVVVPRAALSGAGTESWRRAVLNDGSFEDICVLVNTNEWVFEGVTGRTTVALTTVERGGGDRFRFHGPYHNLDNFEQAQARDNYPGVDVPEEDFASWSDNLTVPLVPSPEASDVFLQMRKSPTFKEAPISHDFRFVRELDTTAQKKYYDFDIENSPRDLEIWTGRSFNIWTPGTGDLYAKAWRKEIEDFLQTRRIRQIQRQDGAFSGFSPGWAQDPNTLPLAHPRIAFRDVARATDTRTFLVCLLPGDVALVEKAPYLFNRTGDPMQEALLLGVLSSRPFDWNARRVIENKVSLGILNSLPVPEMDPTGVLETRLIENSGRLAAVDDRFTEWAAAVGVGVATANDAAVKSALIAENDAIVAKLYGLTADQLKVLFHTFHIGWDYEDDLARTLEYFEALED